MDKEKLLRGTKYANSNELALEKKSAMQEKWTGRDKKHAFNASNSVFNSFNIG